jgi:hypothetical protein
MPRSQVEAVLRYLARRRWDETVAGRHWEADQYHVAWLTVFYATTRKSRKRLPWWVDPSKPYESACFTVYGCHPDQLWFNICERRRALLGSIRVPPPVPITPAKSPQKTKPLALAKRISA